MFEVTPILDLNSMQGRGFCSPDAAPETSSPAALCGIRYPSPSPALAAAATASALVVVDGGGLGFPSTIRWGRWRRLRGIRSLVLLPWRCCWCSVRWRWGGSLVLWDGGSRWERDGIGGVDDCCSFIENLLQFSNAWSPLSDFDW